MADIFISYKREDIGWAKALSRLFESQGWSVWWDRQLAAGESFDEVIEKEIVNAKCVIVLWSSTSVKSRWVISEAGEGLERNILVPVIIEEVKPPLAFRRIHAARLVGWNGESQSDAYEQLVRDIKRIIPIREEKEPEAIQISDSEEITDLELKKVLSVRNAYIKNIRRLK